MNLPIDAVLRPLQYLASCIETRERNAKQFRIDACLGRQMSSPLVRGGMACAV